MSDHISGPRALADPIADITDVYAFPSPERPEPEAIEEPVREQIRGLRERKRVHYEHEPFGPLRARERVHVGDVRDRVGERAGA